MAVWRKVLAVCGAATVGSVGYVIGRSHGDGEIRLDPSSVPYVRPVHAATALESITLPDNSVVEKQPPSSIGPSRVSEIMRFGYPGYDNLKTYEDFVVSYDRRFRTAHWVMEHLTPERLVYNPSVDRSKCQFREDDSIHPYFRSTNQDYRQSGYDRGHLAAAGNHRKTQNSVDQTFLLSNMAPQVGQGFNRTVWNELEKHVRKLARESRNVYVCTGPLYLPRMEADGRLRISFPVIGPNHVAVPTHFFKVVLFERSPDRWFMESYVLPNSAIDDDVPLKSFQTPVESIERAAGFHIFHNLPRQSVVSINGQK